jgi:ribonuclease J
VDQLFLTGAKVKYIKRKDVASMHARQDDLKLMLSLLKPSYYLPIRGSYTQMLENAKLAVSMGIGLNHMNVFVLENGTVLNFNGTTTPRIYNDANIDATQTIVDGRGVGDVENDILEERNKIGENGVIIIATSISLKQRKITAKPDCQMRGFVFLKDYEPLLRNVIAIFTEEILNELNRTRDGFDNQRVVNLICERSAKIIYHNLRREPVIVPIIIEEE